MGATPWYGQVVDGRAPVGADVGDDPLIPALQELQLLELREVALGLALRLAGVPGDGQRGRMGARAVSSGVPCDRDQGGDEMRRDVLGVVERPQDGRRA